MPEALFMNLGGSVANTAVVQERWRALRWRRSTGPGQPKNPRAPPAFLGVNLENVTRRCIARHG